MYIIVPTTDLGKIKYVHRHLLKVLVQSLGEETEEDLLVLETPHARC